MMSTQVRPGAKPSAGYLPEGHISPMQGLVPPPDLGLHHCPSMQPLLEDKWPSLSLPRLPG